MKKVLLNCKHEVVLMLTKNLGDVLEQSRNEQTFKLEMTNIAWKIFHVTPTDFANFKMFDIIQSGVSLPIAFRSWFHLLTQNRDMGVSTAAMRNFPLTAKKPRFLLIGFTLNGEVITNNLSNLKVHLNSES